MPPVAVPAVVPMCDDVPPISAAATLYRDAPIYVANEMPVDEVRAWAAAQPGFEDIWIDREHLGWITLAFSRDADLRQLELRQRFPDVGAVVVAVPWTMADLEHLQAEVHQRLPFVSGSGIQSQRGVVTIFVGPLLPERVAAVQSDGRAGRPPPTVEAGGSSSRATPGTSMYGSRAASSGSGRSTPSGGGPTGLQGATSRRHGPMWSMAACSTSRW